MGLSGFFFFFKSFLFHYHLGINGVYYGNVTMAYPSMCMRWPSALIPMSSSELYCGIADCTDSVNLFFGQKSRVWVPVKCSM